VIPANHLFGHTHGKERHLNYFAAFAKHAQNGIYSTEQAAWFERIENDIDNLRAALDWPAITNFENNQFDHHSALENRFVIISSLSLFWERGYRNEIIEILKKLLTLDSENKPTVEKAKALDVGGFLLWSLNKLPEARIFLEESIKIAEQFHDDSILVWPMIYLGWTLKGLKEYESAKNYLEKALTIAQSLGEDGKTAVGGAMLYLGDLPFAQGDLVEARKLYEDAIPFLRELQNPSMLASPLRQLAYLEVEESNLKEAAKLFSESLELNRQLDHQQGVLACLAGFAAINLQEGNIKKAAMLLGCVEHLLKYLGEPFLSADTVQYEHTITRLKGKTDERTLAAAWSIGRALTLEQAVVLAQM